MRLLINGYKIGLLGLLSVWGGMSYGDSGRTASTKKSLNGWELLSRHSAADAMAAFERMPLGDERNLGLATALLGQYPQTKQNVARAVELLETVIESEGSPKLRSLALYLRARLDHLFFDERNQSARHYYQQLREDYPNSILADNAAVKLALIEIERIRALGRDTEVELDSSRLVAPRSSQAQGQFYYTIGSYYIESGNLQLALENLLRVLRLDTLVGRNRADILVQIGRLATALDQAELALKVYQEFLADNPLDTRHRMVSDLVAELSKEEAR